MYKIGDKVILPYDDQVETQEIIGKVVAVVGIPMSTPPFWMDVELDGKVYSIRGNDARPAQ